MIEDELGNLYASDREDRFVLKVANQLIADYKSLGYEERFAEHNTGYTLQDDDKASVEQKAAEAMGNVSWNGLGEETRKGVLDAIEQKYQEFFASSKRDYFKVERIFDKLQNYLIARYP